MINDLMISDLMINDLMISDLMINQLMIRINFMIKYMFYQLDDRHKQME